MKIAIFDFDGTLFKKQTIPFLMKCYKERGGDRRAYRKLIYGLLKILFKYKTPFISYGKEEFRGEATTLFIKMFNGKSFRYLEEFFSYCTPYIVKELNENILIELQKAKSEGKYTVLLSGCYGELLKKIGEKLGFDEVIGTDLYPYVENGILNVSELRVTTGERKVEKLLERLKNKDVNWDESVAYGDSLYDESILIMVGNPIAVTPDVELKKIAIDRSWSILE